MAIIDIFGCCGEWLRLKSLLAVTRGLSSITFRKRDRERLEGRTLRVSEASGNIQTRRGLSGPRSNGDRHVLPKDSSGSQSRRQHHVLSWCGRALESVWDIVRQEGDGSETERVCMC